MGSSHEKKHKHHKHSSHKHKKHHHKKHHHKHKKEKKSKRETDVKESDVASMDEEALLRQALMTKESAMLEAVPSDDDSDSSTDAATGQISSDHSKNITQSVNEGNSVTAGATRVSASTSNTNILNTNTASTGSTNTVNTAASAGSTNEVDKPEAPATNTNVKEGVSGDCDTAKDDNDVSEREETGEGVESQHDVSIKESSSSRGRSGKRSHRNRSRERNRSRSREARDSKRRRSRSHSRSGKRVESQRKKGSKSRRSRSRSASKSRSRRRSRTRSRSRTRRQGRSRSRRRHRSRSRSGNRSRRDRSRSWSRRRRNRSRRSRSRSKSGSRYSSPRSSKEKEENPYASYPIPVIKTKADIIAEFTAFCRDLSHNERENAAAVDVEQYHPFELSNEKEDTNKGAAATSATQVVVDVNSGYDIRPVEMRFPVSSGLTHQNDTNTNGQEQQQQQSLLTNPNMSVAEIMSERALIQQRLLINPADTAAAMLLKELDNKMSRWCQGQTVPGRYTGITEVTPLDKSVHKMGVQAWAKKKMFYGLRPVREGFGMKLMKRMGWREGEPLGKAKEGHIEPIPVDVKTDRQGLSTEEDKVASVVSSTTVPSSDQTPTCLQGKHPVCALQELCSKKQWDPPSYDIVSETGPQHMRTFVYKVKVNGEYYQPSCGTSNKKLAKAQAALTCLKSLGLIANK